MAYLKPPAFVNKIFNPLAMRFQMSGSKILTVTRRSSGTPQRVPVIPVEYEGTLYVVSTRGESEWVRNVRAAKTLEIESKGQVTKYSVTELPVEQRSPIIDAYRQKAGRTVTSYWKKLPDPADHPVFRLEPA
jgi:deazaflavin-dependent oxidoreductase (nitroreductase family)